MLQTYLDLDDNNNALREAEVILQHIHNEVEDKNMSSTTININTETLCHCLELLLAYAGTYEGYQVGGYPIQVAEANSPTH